MPNKSNPCVNFWCFTLINYTCDDKSHLNTIFESRPTFNYAVYSIEKLDNGKSKIHGFIILPRPQRSAYLHDLISNANFVPAHMRAEWNRDHCIMKGDYIEFGKMAK